MKEKLFQYDLLRKHGLFAHITPDEMADKTTEKLLNVPDSREASPRQRLVRAATKLLSSITFLPPLAERYKSFNSSIKRDYIQKS